MMRFMLLLLALSSVATAVHAVSTDELRAQVRFVLSQNTQANTMAPEEYEALVTALVAKAEAEGIQYIDTHEVSVSEGGDVTARATSACEGLMVVCALAWYLNISFMHTWWLLLGLLTGALLLFLIFWEIHHKHAHPLLTKSVLAK